MRAVVDALKGWFAAVAAAFQFLSRFPVPVRLNYTEELFRRSTVGYPLVGLAIGLAVLGAAWLLDGILSAGPAAALVLAIWVALTGGLHLDGLMDTADGILSHRPREKMLEIMKDSRVGAMGVLACALVLLLKWSLLTELIGRWPSAWLLPLVPVWSRWYMVAAIASWPYARQGQEGGMGGMFRSVRLRHTAAAGILAVLLSAAVVATMPAAEGRLAAALTGFLLLLTCAVAGNRMSAYIHRKLGGLTGDTYGAMNELLETLLLLVLLLVMR
jgi:adenosylcobinamide-GDP ribazoletransferase